MAIRNFAQEYYSTNSASTRLPKQKYQFAVDFFVNPVATALTGIDGRYFDAVQVTLPSVNYNVQTLNSYNKKHIATLNKTYQPVSITIYDDKDSVLTEFLKAYDAIFFNQPAPDIRSSNFNPLHFSQASEGVKLADFQDPLFAINIQVYGSHEDGRRADIYNLIRPVITNVSRDQLNYADSSPIMHQLTVEYEYFTTSLGRPDRP